jgi:hypothetical protein
MVSLLLLFLLGAYYFFSSQVFSLSQDGTHLGSPHFDRARRATNYAGQGISSRTAS